MHVIDAIHLGPYKGGHSWGTMNTWPGFNWPWTSSWGGGLGFSAFPGHQGWLGYPSLGFYKSKVPKSSKKSDTMSSEKGDVADSNTKKRWWPGNMGGWGGWGLGNWGYPGWGWGVG